MSAKLTKHVALFDSKGNLVQFAPGDDVPAWARKKITNRAVWDGEHDDESAAPHDVEVPASHASKGEWVAYAESNGVDVDGLTKAEIVAACEEAGVPVE